MRSTPFSSIASRCFGSTGNWPWSAAWLALTLFFAIRGFRALPWPGQPGQPANRRPPRLQHGDRRWHRCLDGVIAWISLVQTDRGKEQPVDLEDWSAHKAAVAAGLVPGETIHTDWPMRLIQSGHTGWSSARPAAPGPRSPPALSWTSWCGPSRWSNPGACCQLPSGCRCCWEGC